MTEHTHCRVCGRVLKNPKSIEQGVGPVCAGKGTAGILNGPNASDWRHEWHGDILVIYDLNLGGRSVTNDMDAILDCLKVQPGTPIIYLDSEGMWDGVEYGENKTVTFLPIRTGNLFEALENMKCMAFCSLR